MIILTEPPKHRRATKVAFSLHEVWEGAVWGGCFQLTFIEHLLCASPQVNTLSPLIKILSWPLSLIKAVNKETLHPTWACCDYQPVAKMTWQLQKIGKEIFRPPPQVGENPALRALAPYRLPSWLSDSSVGSTCLPRSCTEGTMVSNIADLQLAWCSVLDRVFSSFFIWSLYKSDFPTFQSPLLRTLDVP